MRSVHSLYICARLSACRSAAVCLQAAMPWARRAAGRLSALLSKSSAALTAVVAVVLAVALSGCEHKTLCYDHTHSVTAEVEIRFDWSEAPDATPPQNPETMCVYFYPKDGGQPQRYDVGAEGGVVRVPQGEYDAITFNSELYSVDFTTVNPLEAFTATLRTTDLSTHLAQAGVRASYAPRADGTEDQRVAEAPEMLWRDMARGLDFRKNDKRHVLEFRPRGVYDTCDVTLKRVVNLEYATAFGGSLSGMAGGMRIVPVTPAEERVILPFPLEIVERESPADSVVYGEFLTFGHCPPAAGTGEHKLVIYVVMDDGNKYYYTYDVTAQVHAAPDPHHIHIVIEGETLPTPLTTGGSGFIPDVEAWSEEETVELEM